MRQRRLGGCAAPRAACTRSINRISLSALRTARPLQLHERPAQSRRRCGRSRGADVGGVAAQMWAESRRRCGISGSTVQRVHVTAAGCAQLTSALQSDPAVGGRRVHAHRWWQHASCTMHHGAHNTASARKCVQVCAHWRLFRRMHVSRRKLPNMHMQTRIHTHARTHTCKHARTCTRAPAGARMHVRAGSITTVTARRCAAIAAGRCEPHLYQKSALIALHCTRNAEYWRTPQSTLECPPAAATTALAWRWGAHRRPSCMCLRRTSRASTGTTVCRARRTLTNGLSYKRCDSSARL
jgi:hypothetical protein